MIKRFDCLIDFNGMSTCEGFFFLIRGSHSFVSIYIFCAIVSKDFLAHGSIEYE